VEKIPRRPIATWDRFQATWTAIQDLTVNAATDQERQRWIKVELALVLPEATGRRLSAIRHLRWEDVDLEKRTLRWRAESDKVGRESIVPVPKGLVEELRSFRKQLSAVSGWLFAGERKPDQPMDRHLFDRWLGVAEEHAGLPKLEGGLWHPYRRKWATERKQLPLKDVAAAGGWKDVETLLTCYQRPDRETLLRVMSEPHKLSDAAVAGQ
jgi:integrase